MAAALGLKCASRWEIVADGRAGDVGVAGGVERNPAGVVGARATQIGRVEQRRSVGAQFHDERIAAAAQRSLGRIHSRKRSRVSLSGDEGVSGRIHCDSVSEPDILPGAAEIGVVEDGRAIGAKFADEGMRSAPSGYYAAAQDGGIG